MRTIYKFWRYNFIQKKYARKRRLVTHTRFVLWTVIFLWTFYTIDKALPKQPKQFLLLFYFLV